MSRAQCVYHPQALRGAQNCPCKSLWLPLGHLSEFYPGSVMDAFAVAELHEMGFTVDEHWSRVGAGEAWRMRAAHGYDLAARGPTESGLGRRKKRDCRLAPAIQMGKACDFRSLTEFRLCCEEDSGPKRKFGAEERARG